MECGETESTSSQQKSESDSEHLRSHAVGHFAFKVTTGFEIFSKRHAHSGRMIMGLGSRQKSNLCAAIQAQHCDKSPQSTGGDVWPYTRQREALVVFSRNWIRRVVEACAGRLHAERVVSVCCPRSVFNACCPPCTTRSSFMIGRSQSCAATVSNANVVCAAQFF